MPELSNLIFDKLSNDTCIREIPFNNLREIESVKDELKNGRSHFGAIEWSAAILSILGIPCTIISNFKTKEARDKAFEQSQYFDADVIDINDNNREYF